MQHAFFCFRSIPSLLSVFVVGQHWFNYWTHGFKRHNDMLLATRAEMFAL